MRNYYCAQKFYWLKIDAEKQAIYSCCKADHEMIDQKWLEKNPGNLFNTPQLIRDRQSMLNNERISGCETACWKIEDKAGKSRRQRKDSDSVRNFTNLYNRPKVLDLVMSGECNLACVYCCKNYSSSWRNDILKNGNYDKLAHYKDRFMATNYDRVIQKLSQNDRRKATLRELIEKEVDIIKDNLEIVVISGGEPFLDSNLGNVLKILKDIPNIEIHTGLGFSENILLRHLDKIKDNKNIKVIISAESVEDNFEFTRFGSTWKTFLKNIDLLKDSNIQFSFLMSYANLNVVDFEKFNCYFQEFERALNFVTTPPFLSPYNLDDETKQNVIDIIRISQFSNQRDTNSLLDVLQIQPDKHLRDELEYYVKELLRRRNIKSLNFLPKSLLKWLNL